MKCPAALLSLAVLALPAAAQDHSHIHGASDPMIDYMAAMDGMMSSMKGMTSSGNPDADFLLMMIPHHQSAIDMARVELEHGTDPETRTIAQTIIDAQEREIGEMREMLERFGGDAP